MHGSHGTRNRTRNGVLEVTRKTGRKGAQFQNRLAVKHGGYIQKFDARTREGRAIEMIQSELVSALGGAENVSVQQLLLIQRCSMKSLKCALIESQLLKNNGQTGERLEQHYLRWCRELRSDLLALGLKRQARPVQGLQQYLAGDA